VSSSEPLIGKLLLVGLLALIQPHFRADETRPVVDVPEPVAKVVKPPTVTSGATMSAGSMSGRVGGWATYYAYHKGQAAAGPALRRALGAGWRGMTVTVWNGARHVTVRLTDWCACGPRHGVPTIIDLDTRDFDDLAPLSVGVLRVVAR
jgi:hypothetical protein